MRQDWYFTFGGYNDPSLTYGYVRIYGTYSEARAAMNLTYGSKWCAQYDSLGPRLAGYHEVCYIDAETYLDSLPKETEYTPEHIALMEAVINGERFPYDYHGDCLWCVADRDEPHDTNCSWYQLTKYRKERGLDG